MASTTESYPYLAPGVLVGLHWHKAGQYHSVQKITVILSAVLVVVVSLALSVGDGGHREAPVYHAVRCSSHGVLGQSPSPSDFLIGSVGKVRVIADRPGFFFPPERHPESGFIGSPAPGVFGSPDQVDRTPDPLLTDCDFGLPEPAPLWRFAERGLPGGIVQEHIGSPAQARLADPGFPERAWLVKDTAIVEGVLTLHSYGLISFELVSETPPGRGYGAAVAAAIDQSTCVPAVNGRGDRITVRCRYRCLFYQGGQPSVSVGRSITARLKGE